MDEDEDFSVDDLKAPMSLNETADSVLKICIKNKVSIDELKEREIPTAEKHTEMEPLESMKLTE